MKNWLKKIGRGWLWVLSFIILILALVELAVIGGIVWLDSKNGQSWIEARINTVNEASEFQIKLKDFSYSFPHGIKIKELTILDDKGEIALIRSAALRLDFDALLLKSLELSLNAEETILYRLPESQEKAPDDEPGLTISSFELPDLYFTSFGLDNLNIETLDIREEAFGIPLLIGLNLDAAVNLDEKINFDADLNIEKKMDNAPIWLPENLIIAGDFDPQNVIATITELQTENELYVVEGRGNSVLSDDSALDFLIEARSKDLSAVSSDLNGEFEINIQTSGTVNNPVINSNGRLMLDQFEERDLSEITFEIRDDDVLSENPTAHGIFQTQYKDLPLKLELDAKVKNGVIAFENIDGDAPELDIIGAVNIDQETNLADGKITVQSNNYGFYQDLLQQDFDGSGTITANLAPLDGVQSVTIQSDLKNVRYNTYSVVALNARATLPDIKNTWPSKANVTAKNIAINENLRVNTLSIALDDQENDSYAFDLDAKGSALQDFTISGNANINGLRANSLALSNIDLALSSAGSTINLNGNVNTQNLDINIKTNNFKLASLPAAVPEQLGDAVIKGYINVEGAASSPVISGDLDLTSVSPLEKTTMNINLKPSYANGQARVDISGDGTGIDTLNGQVAFPMTLSIIPWSFELPNGAPLSGQINLDAKAGNIAQIFLPPMHRVKGDIEGNVRLGGAMNSPQINGSMSLRNGNYEYREYGLEFTDIIADASFDTTQITLERFSANGAGEEGTISGDGRIELDDDMSADIGIIAQNLHLLDSEKADGYFDGDINLTGDNNGYLLEGEVRSSQIDIVIPEQFQQSIPQLNIVEEGEERKEDALLKKIALDLRFIADNQIFVRGWGLDAEFGGNLDIRGTLAEPEIEGALSARRGRYEEFGRRFELTRTDLRFQGRVPPSPYFDISASTSLEDIEAIVNLTGQVEDPELSLSSVPALPEDEVMARILFGRDMSSITPFQAIKLKQTLDRFSGRGGGGFDPLGKLRDITGLDDIRVDSSDGSTTAGVGKYLTDDVYLELEKGAAEGSGAANVEIELTPNITLESTVGEDAKAGGGVLWKWDY